MPNIVIQIPKGILAEEARTSAAHQIAQLAADVEQMPVVPSKRMLSWAVFQEIEKASWSVGGHAIPDAMVPCMVEVKVPAGVLDDAMRSAFVKGIYAILEKSMPAGDQPRVMMSTVFFEVADGCWGANGAIWKLPEFARAAGYGHLQHLVPAALPE